MKEPNRLREFRIKQGMNQEEFAAAIDMKQQQYSRYESGERDPQLKHIRRICKRFNVSADWLFMLTPDEEGDENP